MTLRWKKNPRETGLSAVGAAPRGHTLYMDGDDSDYFATVSPNGGGWREKQNGWYWSAPRNDEYSIPLYNSFGQEEIFETEKEAKAVAKKYVESFVNKKETK